ncbi:MAG: hypothetical protein OHK0039_01710 [Bacteroidia bacterium]
MQIEEKQHATYITLIPEGELDAHSSVHLDDRIQRLIESGKINIHIDGKGIRYISSAGLGVFISYLDELAERKGKFILTSLNDNVREVFILLGLNKLDNLLILDDETAVSSYFS